MFRFQRSFDLAFDTIIRQPAAAFQSPAFAVSFEYCGSNDASATMRFSRVAFGSGGNGDHHAQREAIMKQEERYERFLALHQRPLGFVMPNAWDGASALLLKEAGFEALGTSSAALAFGLGRLDGRHAVSRGEHLDHANLLSRVSGLPINGDFEDGYGETASDVADTTLLAIHAGLAGIGIEDTSGKP
jgi:hypothetical protein